MTKAIYDEVADYLLGVDFTRTDDGLRSKLITELVTRWPNASRQDLEVGFQIAQLEMAAQLSNTVADHCADAAGVIARSAAANAIPA